MLNNLRTIRMMVKNNTLKFKILHNIDLIDHNVVHFIWK
jgi:hypothetical protein